MKNKKDKVKQIKLRIKVTPVQKEYLKGLREWEKNSKITIGKLSGPIYEEN